MREVAVEEKMDSSPTSPGTSEKNGFEELVRGIHGNETQGSNNGIGNDEFESVKEGDLTSQEYIQKLVSESLKTSFVSPFDKVADDSEFHYTSSFKARPQAEYFDFDEKYMYKPEKEQEYNQEEKNEEKDYLQEKHESEYEDEGMEMEMEIEGEDEEVEGEDELQSVIDTVGLCKAIFGDMIDKIDKVALTSVTYKSTKMGVTQMDREISDVLDTVGDIVPNSENSELLNTTRPLHYQQRQGLGGSLGVNGDHVRGRSTSSQLVQDTSDESTRSFHKSLRYDPCAHLPNFGVILIKSPASVSQLWDEYTKIPAEWPVKDLFTFTLLQQGGPNNVSDIELITKRRTSIKQLEASLGSSWRNADKNFSRQINRRKKIWKSIEEGLSDGLTLHTCFNVLENYVKNKGKGLSWYYNGVPFRLSDVCEKLPANKRK